MHIRLTTLIALFLYFLGNIKCQYHKLDPKLGGLICPVFTPMDEMENLNLTVIPEYAKYIRNSGLDGVLDLAVGSAITDNILTVGGIAGEGINLSVLERKKLIDSWMVHAKSMGLKVIIHIGGIPGPDMTELIKYVITIRVHGIMIYPTVCHHPNSAEEFTALIDYVASNAKGLPIFYNDDACCLTGKHEGLVQSSYFKMASEKILQFKGIRTIIRNAMVIEASTKLRKDQIIFILNYSAFASGTLLGYDSFIVPAMNLFPELIKEIIISTDAADISTARKYQKKLNKLVIFIQEQGDHIAAEKAAFKIITGINIGPPRFPLQPIPKKGIEKIKDILKDYDIKIAKH